MTMNIVRGCSYNPMTNTLSLSESFVKKASRLGTPEYKMVLQYQKDHPGLKMAEMEKKPSDKKKANITYALMEGIIGHCRDKDSRMKQYKRMRSWAELQPGTFHKMKNWFLNNYANYDNMDDFDADGYFLPKTKEEYEKAKEDAKKADAKNNTITENN